MPTPRCPAAGGWTVPTAPARHAHYWPATDKASLCGHYGPVPERTLLPYPHRSPAACPECLARLSPTQRLAAKASS